MRTGKAGFAIMALALGIALDFAIAGRSWFDDGPEDPDTWMRLAFLDWGLHGHGLTNYDFIRDGAPFFNLPLHWTLPYDAAVVLLAAPFAIFAGWHEGLSRAALLASPVATAAAALAAAHLSKSLGMGRSAPWAAALAALSPSILAYSDVGRVGHHVATAAIGTMAISAAIRFSRFPSGRGAWFGPAAWMTLACWQSMETIPAVASAWAVVACSACARGIGNRGFLKLAVALAILPILALLADGPGYRAASALDGIHFAIDRYSEFHLTMLLNAAATILTARATRRFGFAAAACAVSVPVSVWGVAMSLLAVSNLPGTADTAFTWYFWDVVGEMKPAWSGTLAAVCASLPILPAIWTVARAPTTSRRKARPVRTAGILGLAALFLAGVLHARLAVYGAEVGAVLLGGAIYRKAKSVTGDPSGDAAYAMFAAFCCAGALAAFFQAAMAFAAPPAKGSGCRFGEAGSTQVAAALPDGALVAADIWASPELLWRTTLSTVAGPYHRNRRGIEDMGDVLASTDDASAEAILASRNVAAFAPCLDGTYASQPIFSHRSLEARLARGEVPAWLRRVPLPGAVGMGLFVLVPKFQAERNGGMVK